MVVPFLVVIIAGAGYTEDRMERTQVPCHNLVLRLCGAHVDLVLSLVTVRNGLARGAMAGIGDYPNPRISDDIPGTGRDQIGTENISRGRAVCGSRKYL